jgi:hypothetical protein
MRCIDKGQPHLIFASCHAVGARQRAGLGLSAIAGDPEIEARRNGAVRRVALRQQFPESFKKVYYPPLGIRNMIPNISGVG